MNRTFGDNVLQTVGITPKTSTAAENAGAGVDMAKYHNYVAVVQLTAATQYSGPLTAVIAESTDNTTYSDTYLATVTIASTTATNGIAIVEVSAEKMSEGYRYLRVEATPTGTVSLISAANLQFNPRFGAVQ
jgi:orotidine-5'-phosphate decarboxylase